jgi:hypothetical protein
MNGYFRLHLEDNGVNLELIPPTDGGEKIRTGELKEYLEMVGVPYDATKLNKAVAGLEQEPVTIAISNVKLEPIDEKCFINVSSDKMTAVLRLFPPTKGGASIRKARLQEELKKEKVISGIDLEEIDKILADKQYCTDLVVAKGKLPTPGHDASIVYNFETDNSARPELKEDGTVDFFKLNLLHHCSKGQVLAEIIPEEKGEDGFDVYGRTMLARNVKKVKFNHGRNMEISEDGLKLISLVDGNVNLVEGAVFVSDVYGVENVDTSTGNIEYNGNVEVNGNVCENFKIKTEGSVFVKGVVEGAQIEAGGNIIIARGMHGQNKGKLKAGGNVIAKFISASDVEAGGFVEAEQILNSNVQAFSIHAEAGKGLINGGKVVAKSVVSMKNAGSPMGTSTIIEVGTDSDAKRKLAELQKSVGEKSQAITKMKKVVEDTALRIKKGIKLTPEQLKNAKMLSDTLQQTQQQVTTELSEIEKLDKLLKGSENAHIEVHRTMYQGVVVSISGAVLNVKNEYTYCRLIKKGADIASTNL